MNRKSLSLAVVIALLWGSVPRVSWAGPAAQDEPPPPETPSAPLEYWDNNPIPLARLCEDETDVQGAVSMVVFKDQLYVGTEDAAAAGTSGAEILGSSDGSTGFNTRRLQTTVAIGQRSGFYALAAYGEFLYAAFSCPNCTTPVSMYRSQTGAAGSWALVSSQPTFSAVIDTVRVMLVWQSELWVFGSNESGAVGNAEIQRYNGTTWTEENIDFFDPGQSGIRSAAEFQGNLYIGTSFTGSYGAQTWRRVPGSAANVWTKLTEDGFGMTGTTSYWNTDVSSLYVYKNALYAGTRNGSSGAELYRTYDGVNWSQLFSGGLGEPGNIAVRSMLEANGDLYLAMQSTDTGQARIFRTVDGEAWSPVSQPGLGHLTNTSVNVLMIFQSSAGRHLYLGTQNITGPATGNAQMWRVKLPTHEESWQQQVGVLRGNAAFDPTTSGTNAEARVFAEYNGALYVGVNNAGVEGGFVYRTLDGQHWTQVGARGIWDIQSATSGATNPANSINAMVVAGGRLFIATGTSDLARVFALGTDGNSWKRIGPDDVGNSNNTEATTLAAFNNQLWVGTANTGDPKGAQVCSFDAPDTANDTSTCTNASPGWLDATNTRITAMEVFTPAGGTARLYIGTQRATGGANLLYRTTSAWCIFVGECPTTDGFNIASPVISEISALKAFNGALYAGTRRQTALGVVPLKLAGGAVYRSITGGQGAPNWSQVSRGGFSRDNTPANTDAYNQAVTAFAVYRNYLYAGTEKPNCNLGAATDCVNLGGEVWRADGLALDYNQTNFPGYLRWDQVGTEGFGFFQNFRIAALYPFKNMLYAGTLNETPTKNGGAGYNYTTFLRTGGEVWRTDIPNQHVNDPCAEGVYVAVRVQAPATLKVTSDAGNDVPRFLPRAGTYEVALNYGPRTYQLLLEYADRSLFRTETIQVVTYADGSMDVKHPTASAPSIGAVKERFWDNRTIPGMVFGATAETVVKTMEVYTDTSGGGSTRYIVAGTVDEVDGAAVLYNTGSGGFVANSSFFAGLGAGAADPNTRAVNDLMVYDSATVGNLMLAATRRNAFPARLYASTDLGNWTVAADSPGEIRSNSWEALAFYSDSSLSNVWLAGNDTTNANRGEMYAVQVSGPSTFNWNRRTPGNLDARQNGFMSLLVYKNYLYAGTRTSTANLGAQLWRYNGRWEMMAQGGIANPNNTAISAMAIHDGLLYVGTTNAADGAELYVSADGVNFQRVWGGGLNNTSNDAVQALYDTDGYLYVGLGSSSGVKSGEIHRSANGWVWSPEIVQGFGVAAPQRNAGIPALLAFDGTDGRFLYAGTARPATVAPIGAQVWRTPLPPPLEDWEQVVLSGFTWGVMGIDAMVEQGDVLYAGVRPWWGVPANGARVYKTIGGRHWTTVGLPNLVAETLFNNTEIDSLAIHNGTLYAGTRVPTGEGGRVYRLKSNGNEWERVGATGDYLVGGAANTAITALYDWNGKLYLGTENAAGAKLYVYYDSLDSFDQVPVAGLTAPNLVISSITSHGSYLFFSTLNPGGGGEPAGGEIWYSPDGSTWTAAISDGFSNVNNTWIPVLQSYTSAAGSHLYALTYNGVQGAQVWRSADGRSGWRPVNRSGFARSSGPTNFNNVIGFSAAAFDGYLYGGTVSASGIGGEVYRTDGLIDPSDVSLPPTLINWAQVNATGYGNPTNSWLRPMLGHGDYLYNAAYGPAAVQVWRARKISKAIDADDHYLLGRVVGVGVRVSTTVPLSLTVTPGGASYAIPSLGTYEVAITTGVNVLSLAGCACGPIYVDTARFDRFNLGAIATPQRISQPFAVTVTPVLSDGTPVAITGTVALATINGMALDLAAIATIDGVAIDPATIDFVNQSSRTVNVTLPVSTTGTGIRATFNGISGTSNLFDVRPLPVLDHFTIDAIGNQRMGNAFPITLRAVDNEGNPFGVTGSVQMADTSATLNPASSAWAAESSKSLSVTVGISITGDVITVSYSGKTGSSNAFNVVKWTSRLLPLVIRP